MKVGLRLQKRKWMMDFSWWDRKCINAAMKMKVTG
jgi:hypothetical protein